MQQQAEHIPQVEKKDTTLTVQGMPETGACVMKKQVIFVVVVVLSFLKEAVIKEVHSQETSLDFMVHQSQQEA
ncbi:hypothetical protein [Kistimonas asteriae]|uniref:hypothetical protein n=1 Tax=Kistimonas asteriae TaxID=517724 RepID=UPI001BA4AC44|nr:hypothetical protein [Kistimonas asteriae]